LQEFDQILNSYLWHVIKVKTNSMCWFLIYRSAVSEPKYAKMLVLALHTFDIPVICFILWICRIKDVFYSQSPVPNTQHGRLKYKDYNNVANSHGRKIKYPTYLMKYLWNIIQTEIHLLD
jgi:hypothetical protein